MTTSDPLDLIVIGAGVAGATAARAVADAGRHVLVLEKSRGLGGRCATRRIDDEVRVDHGAQFFTVRETSFEQRIASWLEQGEVVAWTHGLPRWTPEGGVRATEGGHPRYVCPAGMSRLGRLLLGDVAVERRAHVSRVRAGSAGWRVELDDGRAWTSRAVLLTPPAPQTRGLLDPDEIDAEAWRRLGGVRYAPSFALMAGFAVEPPSWPGVQFEDHPVLSWIANEASKRPPSGGDTILVAHGTAGFAQEHFDHDAEAVADALERAVVAIVAPGSSTGGSPRWRRLHRWRYAQAETPLSERTLALAPGLHAAGDGFGAGRVEGAFLSGAAAAEAILSEARSAAS